MKLNLSTNKKWIVFSHSFEEETMDKKTPISVFGQTSFYAIVDEIKIQKVLHSLNPITTGLIS